MTLTVQNKIILFLSYLKQQPVKNQLIWIYCLSKINKINEQIIPAHEILFKTNTKLHQFKSIVLIGNQYLQSIGFEYNFINEGENLLINKVDVPKKNKKKRLTKSELKKAKLQKNEILINQVIDYLNECAGTDYTADIEIFCDPVLRWIEEGYKLAQFKHVIEVKCYQWLNNDKMNMYLRPQTLFGDKFEAYVREKLTKTQSSHERIINAAEEAKSNLFSAGSN